MSGHLAGQGSFPNTGPGECPAVRVVPCGLFRRARR